MILLFDIYCVKGKLNAKKKQQQHIIQAEGTRGDLWFRSDELGAYTQRYLLRGIANFQLSRCFRY